MDRTVHWTLATCTLVTGSKKLQSSPTSKPTHKWEGITKLPLTILNSAETDLDNCTMW